MTRYSPRHPLYQGKWNARIKMEIDDSAISNLVMSSDDNFDEAIRRLDMRGLIGLVSELQTEMTSEQQRFDELSKQLELNNLNDDDYQLTSALCASQARLALLCARNMKCFTQQAVKAKQEQATLLKGTSSEPPPLNGTSPPPHCPKRFQEKLQFFQSKQSTPNGNNHCKVEEEEEENEEDEDDCLSFRGGGNNALNSSFSSPNLTTCEEEEDSDHHHHHHHHRMGKNQRTNHHTTTEAATCNNKHQSGPFPATCWEEDGGGLMMMYARSSSRKSKFHPRSTGAATVVVSGREQESNRLPVVGRGLSRRVRSLDDGLNDDDDGFLAPNEKIERVPSVEEILQIVKDLRMRSADNCSSVVVGNGISTSNNNHEKQQQQQQFSNGILSKKSATSNMRDKPEPIYVNVSRREPVYDVPPKVISVNRTEPVVPTATQLVLQATSKAFSAKDVVDDDDALSDCDKDSLEDDRHPPDIPSPDYGSDEDDSAYGVYDNGYPKEYSSSLSEVEVDGRLMYYSDDQILEVIVEEEEDEDEDYNSGPYEKGSSMDYSSLDQSTNKSVRSNDTNGEDYETSDDFSIQKERNNGNHDNKKEKFKATVLIQSDKSDFSDSAVDLREISSSNGHIIQSDSADSQDSSQFSSDNELHFSNVSTPKTREQQFKIQNCLPVSYAHVNSTEESNQKQNSKRSVKSNRSEDVRPARKQTSNGVRTNGESLTNNSNNMDEFWKRDMDEFLRRDDEPSDSVVPSLPSVKALRNQFEVKQNGNVVVPLPRNMGTFTTTRRTKPPTSFSSLWANSGESQSYFSQTLPSRHSHSSIARQGFQSIPETSYSFDEDRRSYTLPKQAHKTPSYYSLQNGSVRTAKPIFSPDPPESPDDMIPSIIAQFGQAALNDEFSRPATSLQWDPSLLLKELYKIQSPQPMYPAEANVSFINIEGYLDKLPSGRKKATFWNAWKRKYFRLKDGYLHYYQNHSADTPSLTLNLMGGHVDSMESTMLGIDDGKGHYMVVRCCNQDEMEQWRRALQTHTAENFSLTYVQPVPAYPHFYEDVVIIDLGSTSVRAGILCTQPTLPQLLFPTVYTIHRDSGKRVYGLEAFSPLNRSTSNLVFPLRQTAKITKQSIDLDAIAGLFVKVFTSLNVDPQDYQVQLSLPRTMSVKTQSEVLQMLFEEFEVKSVNLTTQTVLSLLSYNATSGIVVDLGERLDVVPIIDGYVVESGVAKIPYGGVRIIEHLRHFLLKRHYLLMSDTDSYIVRYILEQACYCAEKYNEELHRFHADPDAFEKVVDLRPFFSDPPWDEIVFDCGAFQAPEGIFNPDAWGLDHPGVHKLVHKAIQECSLDIRKEMTRGIYLSGGLTLLPGFTARLELEVDKLTPPSLSPKVHGSPYRYHAAYLGACVLAGSAGFQETKITRRDWLQNGANCLKKWHL